ncbi:MAG: hypothetical protein J7501_15340, partial [Bdellovibrio sp.]|nr:hypothetical protein [Bdellovibrio sp.]
YKFAYQANVINADGTSKPWSREDSREVMKPSASTDSALKVAKLNLHKLSSVQTMSDDLQMTLGFERLIMLAHSCEMTDELQKYCVENLKVDSCEIKCGNLSSVAEVRDAPPLIAKQTNCGGLKDCKLNVKKVTFDWTIILKTGQNVEKQKVSYTLAMTQDLPFLSRVLDYCSRGLVQIPNSSSKVLVTVCNRVKNFERDTATP